MINFNQVFPIIGFIIFIILIAIYIQKIRHSLRTKRIKKARLYMYKLYQDKSVSKKQINDYFLFKNLVDLENQIKLNVEEKQKIFEVINIKKLTKKFQRMTRSIFLFRRIKGVRYLSYIQTDDAIKHLKHTLRKARYNATIFYAIYGLIDVLDEETYALILKKLKRLNLLYLRRTVTVLSNHFGAIQPFITSEIDSEDERIIYFLTFVSKKYYAIDKEAFFKRLNETYIRHDVTSELGSEIQKNLLEALLLRSHDILRSDHVLHHKNPDVRLYGFKALSRLETKDAFLKLLELSDSYERQINDIVKTIKDNFNVKELLFHIIEHPELYKETNQELLFKLIANHISTVVFELESDNKQTAKKWIEDLVKHEYTSSIIQFLNENTQKKIENTLYDIIFPIIKDNQSLKTRFQIHLQKDVLKKFGLQREQYEQKQKESMPFELSKIIWMTAILIVTVLWYPSLSLARHGLEILNTPILNIVKTVVVDTNYYLVVYFFFANMIYFLLLVLSVYGAYKQNTLWELKPETLLFEDELLPSISIIAPAYNEEVSIISNVQALLNLKYPNYEVIVVNDGSKDNTLDVVINEFDLERDNPSHTQQLNTKTVRGIYTTPKIPNLVVIDKANGGKADALNVGINKAEHPYVCGIDADSILEQDALLRLLSSALDHSKPAVALGGNIIPANNSIVDRGHIEQVRFPKTTLTRFQAIEYLRAFTSGRIGWSLLNSLLIISGAFGVFKKQDIIEIGGYITSSGEFKKDTVGEDMELVVRLTHNKLRKKEDYYISYIYHAGCHTELPSDIKTLLKQRNRWHRGLIDILSYHRSILFNPRYKQVGFFAVPYFYIFEVIGPFIESIGYLSLILSLSFGFLEPMIVLNFFVLTIAIGIIVSLMSLFVSEKVTPKTTKKEVFTLILFAIFENFGYRQLISFHRVYSFFTAYVEQGNWGEQKRSGFKQDKS